MTPAIAFGIDAGFPMPLAVSLRSVLEKWNKDLPLEIFVLHAKLPAKTREKVVASLPTTAKAKLQWINVDLDKVAGLPAGGHYSSASYFRLLVPELLPAEIGAALYLDADTVALTDLSALFALYEDKFAAQACLDTLGSIGNPALKLTSPESLGLRHNSPYYNTGVLLMNLKRWRKEKFGTKILEFGRKNPNTLTFASHLVTNLCISAEIGKLPSEWNAQTGKPKTAGISTLPQDLNRAKILHYSSEVKPWSSGRALPEAAAFKEIVARTEWAPK